MTRFKPRQATFYLYMLCKVYQYTRKNIELEVIFKPLFFFSSKKDIYYLKRLSCYRDKGYGKGASLVILAKSLLRDLDAVGTKQLLE